MDDDDFCCDYCDEVIPCEEDKPFYVETFFGLYELRSFDGYSVVFLHLECVIPYLCSRPISRS